MRHLEATTNEQAAYSWLHKGDQDVDSNHEKTEHRQNMEREAALDLMKTPVELLVDVHDELLKEASIGPKLSRGEELMAQQIALMQKTSHAQKRLASLQVRLAIDAESTQKTLADHAAETKELTIAVKATNTQIARSTESTDVRTRALVVLTAFVAILSLATVVLTYLVWALTRDMNTREATKANQEQAVAQDRVVPNLDNAKVRKVKSLH